jgi:hypothetical protein
MALNANIIPPDPKPSILSWISAKEFTPLVMVPALPVLFHTPLLMASSLRTRLQSAKFSLYKDS